MELWATVFGSESCVGVARVRVGVCTVQCVGGCLQEAHLQVGCAFPWGLRQWWLALGGVCVFWCFVETMVVWTCCGVSAVPWFVETMGMWTCSVSAVCMCSFTAC